jgi:hypothetical protein
VALYLCFRFRIFDRPILEEYVSYVEGGPHLFRSCLRALQDGLPPTTKEMHFSFENMDVNGTPSLQASLMDIHHNISLRFILQDTPFPQDL